MRSGNRRSNIFYDKEKEEMIKLILLIVILCKVNKIAKEN